MNNANGTDAQLWTPKHSDLPPVVAYPYHVEEGAVKTFLAYIDGERRFIDAATMVEHWTLAQPQLAR